MKEINLYENVQVSDSVLDYINSLLSDTPVRVVIVNFNDNRFLYTIEELKEPEV